MSFNLQPSLKNDLVELVPLQESDFDNLYAVAADPLIWEQHPNPDRYRKEVFEIFFQGAIDSGGAFIVYDRVTRDIVGTSRYYEWNEQDNSIAIGYTFIARQFWGKGFNGAMKKLMVDYAFQYVDKVILHIGATNYRSQKAIEKLGATKIAEVEVAYYGEPEIWNFLYQIEKNAWKNW